jgi:predicted Fe-Mo cluster-binding NifX family protein
MSKEFKIAAVTDDGETISRHFGRAGQYAVISVVNNRVVGRELRPKAGHHGNHQKVQVAGDSHSHEHSRPEGEHQQHLSPRGHAPMFAAILDCELVLARGMGFGAYQGAEQSGLRPIITDIAEVDAAIQAVIDGTIVDHKEKLH